MRFHLGVNILVATPCACAGMGSSQSLMQGRSSMASAVGCSPPRSHPLLALDQAGAGGLHFDAEHCVYVCA